MLYAIIGMLVIIADQAIKFWVSGHVAWYTEGVPLIPNILSLTNVHNEGAAFGFLSGSGARIPFIILAGVFALVVIIALATNLISGKLARWSIVLVTAGGLSNCIDRVIYGYVQDMFKLEFINFPVFNLADVFITVFAIVFALAILFGKTRRDEDDEDDFEFEDDEEDEPKVSRRKQKKANRAKKRSRYDEDEYEEEEEEEEEPVRKPARSAKKASRVREEEYEEPVAARKPQAKAKKAAETEPEEVDLPAPRRAGAKPAQKQAAAAQEDPFAAWDRAESQTRSPRAAARKVPAPKSEPVQLEKPERPAPKAAPAAAPAKPAPRPAAKPEPEEEFSLDDILNEFR